MSSQNSKTFFKKLKETCKKIDSDISEINKNLTEVPCNEELASKRMVNYRDKIKNLKAEANELKAAFEPQLAHTRDFIQNFKEVLEETVDQVAKQEDYLKQYGYEPLSIAVNTPAEEDVNMLCVEQSAENKRPSTPTLLDYGIVSSRNNFTFNDPQLNSAKNTESSGSTPTLDLCTVLVMEKETPPIPECLQPSIEILPSTPTLKLD